RDGSEYAGQRGVYLPFGVEYRAGQRGDLFVVEGGSCTAAVWSMGLATVGLPNNGTEPSVAALLYFLDRVAARRVVFVKDRKAGEEFGGEGGGAGGRLGDRAEVLTAPAPAKDSRAWLLAKLGERPIEWVGDAGRRRLGDRYAEETLRAATHKQPLIVNDL